MLTSAVAVPATFEPQSSGHVSPTHVDAAQLFGSQQSVSFARTVTSLVRVPQLVLALNVKVSEELNDPAVPEKHGPVT